MTTYTPAQLRTAALETLKSDQNAYILNGMITDRNAASHISAVSEAVGRDISPYRADGTLDGDRFPDGVNLAPYLRSVLKRWAAVQK